MRKVFVTVLIIAGTLGLAHGEAGLGQKYDTRDPFACKSKKEPAKGAPSPSQAKDYLRCRQERVLGNEIYLLENVQLEVGKGRPFQGGGLQDLNMGDIDPSFPVYPIRGSFDQYQCGALVVGGLANINAPRGKNCNMQSNPNVTGACYKTTFGDWTCMATGDNSVPAAHGVPGPK
jgi:hypothetical protein